MTDGSTTQEMARAARAEAAGWLAVFSPAGIPALLQTAAYARLAVALSGEVHEDDAAKAAAVRIEAQAVLSRPGRKFAFVLTEGAVRTWPGSPTVMAAQLDRLVQVSALPHVRLGVVPWSAPTPAFPLHGFTIYDGSMSVIESFTGDLSLTETAELAAHEEIFERFAAAAVYDDDLRILLGKISAHYRALAT